MKSYFLILLAIPVLFSMNACQRDDDEPVRVAKSISRLYVSTSEYQAGSAGADFFNIWAIDGVNAEELPSESTFYKFTSPAKGGNMIHYSPFNSGMLFQGSINNRSYIDTAVYAMDISKTGVITNKSSLRSRIFDKVRGLFYKVVNEGQVSEDYLLVVNASDTTNGANTPNYNLFAMLKPRNAGNYSKPRFRMKLEHNPWGIIGVGNDLLISKADANGGVVVYKNFMPRLLTTVDSVMTASENYRLDITGANNIRGISYSEVDDILLVTDFAQDGAGVSAGRILVFEKFSGFKSAQTITPTRIITGANTQLKEPVDVAIDGKADSKYFFVADPTAKKVLRFSKTDSGNVAPNGELTFDNKSPVSISLDSR